MQRREMYQDKSLNSQNYEKSIERLFFFTSFPLQQLQS